MRCSIAQQRRATQLFRLAHSSPAGRRHIAFTSQAQPNMAAAAPQEQGVFVLVVTGKLKDGCLPKLLANFKPLAEYVQAHEEGCLSYKLSLGAEDPNRLVIFERYVSKEYLEQVHWQSDAFKTFGAKNREDGVEWEVKEVLKYYETDMGFMSK